MRNKPMKPCYILRIGQPVHHLSFNELLVIQTADKRLKVNMKTMRIEDSEDRKVDKHSECKLNGMLMCEHLEYMGYENGSIVTKKETIKLVKTPILSMNSNSQFLFFGSTNSTIHKINLLTKVVEKQKTGLKGISAVKVCSEFVVCGSWNNKVWIMDLDLNFIKEISHHSDSVDCIEYIPKIKVLSKNETSVLVLGSKDGTVSIWEL